MRELKPKCAARIFFDFFWAFMAPGSNNYKCGVDYSVDRERKIREGEEGTLAACLHFRFFTPRLGFDCGLSGSKQPPAAVANLSMYLALDTWPGEEWVRGKGEQEEESTHYQALPAGNRTPSCCSWSLSNANCLGLLSSPNLALAFQIVWPRICRDLLMIRCGTVLQVEVGSGPSRGNSCCLPGPS